LYCYTTDNGSEQALSAEERAVWNQEFTAYDGGGLYKLNPVDPQLETAWFQQPLNL
jgi:hypothetical protein